MVYAQPRISPRKRKYKLHSGSSNPDQTTGPNDSQQKKKTSWIVDFADPVDHRGKSKVIENGQNSEKSSGDLRNLAVTQYPVKDHQLTLMGKTHMCKQ